MIDLDQLETLAKAATPGEWIARADGWTIRAYAGNELAADGVKVAHTCAMMMPGQGSKPDIEQQVANQEFIAAATPTAILELVAEVRRLREERTGPGTPSARLCFLLNGLNERFPDAVDKYSSEPAEPKLLEAVDALIEDAQRYRWLRDGEEDVFCMFGSNGSWGECGHIEIYGDRLDEHIDAARAKDQP